MEKSAEENGMKICREKIKYLRPDNCHDKMYSLRKRLPTVDPLSYLGSTIQAKGRCKKDVTNRIRAGWNRRREMSGVICHKKVPEILKNKQQLDAQ